MSLVEDFLGQPINLISTTTAQGGDYALHDSIVTAYLDAQHTNFGSGNDVGLAGAVYDRPLRNYIEYIRSADAKYLTRAHSGVVGYRDNYLIPASSHANEPNHQYASMALHYLYTSDATTLNTLGDVADYMCGLIDAGYITTTTGSNSARLMAHALEALIAARYISAPSDGAPGGYPGGNNFATRMDAYVDTILGTMSSDGGHRFEGDTYYTYAYQEGLLDEALIHYYLLYANPTRKAAILAQLIKRENFRWTVMLDQYANALGPALIYLEGPNTAGGESALSNYQPPGSSDLAAWSVGPCGFLYNQTADPTYRVRGLQLLHTSYSGDHSNNGAYLTTIASTPSGSTQGIQHKILSELTRTSWRALYYFLNTPAVSPSGVPINTALPAITQPTPGNFVCSPGTWSNSPSSYNYAWCRRPSGGGVNTVLQTGSSPNYLAHPSDVGSRLFCLITANNGTGASINARAAESAVVTNSAASKIRVKWR